METNIKKVSKESLKDLNQSSAAADQQPLKLLSSLTNMVNSANSDSSEKFKTTGSTLNTLNKQQKSNLVNIANPVGSMPNAQWIRPILYQLAGSSNSITITPKSTTTMAGASVPQQITHAQLLELQKTILASHSLANKMNKNNKTTTNTAGNLRISGNTVTVNTKLPVFTAANRVKSAFTQRQNKVPSSISSNQVHITPLLQQRNILQVPNTNPLLSMSKTQLTTAALNKLQSNPATPSLKNFAEQIKALTPQQREILIKQYTASGKLSLPQLQTALANTANPMVLASVLKNRQVVPTAMTLSPMAAPKKIVNTTQLLQRQLAETQKKLATTKVAYFFFFTCLSSNLMFSIKVLVDKT